MITISKVDVCIPVYRPGSDFQTLLELLQMQSFPIHRILIANTEQKYWDASLEEKYPRCCVTHISKKDFDHGSTRRMLMNQSDADLVVFMTQDAVPKSVYLIEELVEAFHTEGVRAAYARQLARKDATLLEKITRNFNYPAESEIKTKADLERLGLKTFFCSNVCAAYHRETYMALGGFPERTIFNEDMIYASKVIEAGYSIAYAAGAKVIHSHNLSGKELFRRNFDLAVSQAEHPEVFEKYPSESEGMKLVKYVVKELMHRGRPWLIFPFGIQCINKYRGYKKGKKYQNLTKDQILKYTSLPDYWAAYK